MKVVMTNTMVPITDEDLKAFDGLDVDFQIIEGTSEQALLDGTRDADAVIILAEQFTKTVIDNLEHCRSLTRFGIGYDTIDVPAATERGIWVTNVPDANYREVAVHAIALALSVTRRLPALDAGIRTEGWASSFFPGVRRPDDQVFGLLGLGRIGRRVATMAQAIGYTVIAFDPVVSAADAADLGVELVSKDAVLERADIVSIHVPLMESTRNIIDAAALARMKKGSVLINVSRGGLIDEAALADALRSGHLFGAGIDAFGNEPLEAESPLRDLDNIILSPHAAHWSEESWNETRRKVLEEAARILRGEHPRNPVNQIERETAA
ncbi:C-terminal binding protein [Schumannella sp. 10F1B-5-1]|uniref:C-terminal binding protein n=1 Tax=Schumannella sp. 10F1B-5-1 TaxID=2590780 RepID=UPI001131DB7F|nr:C-terminal binding protein [Schumannella sp. 10F1B-5-1]TPW78310.1 C-terminal binding protein [Schumannella sp. 10F1B-5-1]